MIITLDGPAGVGKSSISRTLAEILHLTYIDTGAMFRGIALAAHERGIDPFDAPAISAFLPEIHLAFRRVGQVDHLFLNGRDVESLIRSSVVSQGASAVATIPEVRQFLLELQRNMARRGPSILEGRDTGTVVFPSADVKFFLDASASVRARRRWLQMQESGTPSGTLEELQQQIEARDRQDRDRAVAPLRCADDAVLIDTSDLSMQEVVATMLQTIRKRIPPKTMPHP